MPTIDNVKPLALQHQLHPENENSGILVKNTFIRFGDFFYFSTNNLSTIAFFTWLFPLHLHPPLPNVQQMIAQKQTCILSFQSSIQNI